MIYQIRIKGHLGPQWTDWFGDVTITLSLSKFNSMSLINTVRKKEINDE